MTTVILVVMCVVVGALELYAGKQSRDQAHAFTRRIDELNDQVTKQNNVLVTVGEQLTAELSRVKQDVLPALDTRLRQNTGQVEELAGLVHQADDYLRTQAGRLHELEQQRITLAALRRKLGEVETSVRAATGAGGEGGGAAVEGKVDAALGLARGPGARRRGDPGVAAHPHPHPGGRRGRRRRAAAVHRGRARRHRHGRAHRTSPRPRRRRHRDGTPVDARRAARGHPQRHVRAVRARQRLAVRFRTAEGANGTPGSPERRRYFLGGHASEDLAGVFSALLISAGAGARPGNGLSGGEAKRGLARVEPGVPAGVERRAAPRTRRPSSRFCGRWRSARAPSCRSARSWPSGRATSFCARC
ncbi:hypothetical protein ACFQY7_54210 [Actinomadura luteofluorescens]|uniref:hypothetical protein n=1 Tax=Actinomadura luteofluorescens TaxID=46163 RepID=UPI0036383488